MRSIIIAAAAGLLGLSSASASVRITYSTTSDYIISNIVTANLDPVNGLTLDQTGATLARPRGSFLDPHMWDVAPTGVFLMGERLDQLGNPHLVLGVNQILAARLLNQPFNTLFPMQNEQLVLGSIELISHNSPYEPALQTLFDFSMMAINEGGTFDPDGGAFTLVSFSNGQAIGSGSAMLAPSPPTTSGVPELGAWMMMTAGFGFVGAVIRRQRLIGVAPRDLSRIMGLSGFGRRADQAKACVTLAERR